MESPTRPSGVRPLVAFLLALAPVGLLAHCGLWPSFSDPPRDGGIDVVDSGRDGDATVDATDDALRTDAPVTDTSDIAGSCANLPAGPFTPEMVLPGEPNARDLAFDNAGGLVTAATRVVRFDAAGTRTELSMADVFGVGLRFLPSGEIAMTSYRAGEGAWLRIVGLDGVVRTIGMGYSFPAGVAVHPSGSVYFSDTVANTIYRLAPDGMTITTATTAVATPSGLAFGPDDGRLYVASPSGSEVFSLAVQEDGTLADGRSYATGLRAGQGLAFDRCGNLYVSDRDNGRVLRVPPGGDRGAVITMSAPASFSPAGLAFGRGMGFDPQTLYTVDASNGAVYRIAVGVAGAELVAPR